MGWSGWNYKDTNISIGGYRLWYRTNDSYSTATVALEYSVEVFTTGDKTERWNCYVGVSVDGTLHSQNWSNYSDKNTTTGAGSTVPGSSGYYTGYYPIGSHTVTKGVGPNDTSRSWTLSLAGGFTAISRRDCTCSVTPSSSYSYSAGAAPTIEVVDNGNNTAVIRGNQGWSGINNPLSWSKYYYTTNGYSPSAGAWHTTTVELNVSQGAAYSKDFTVTSDTTITAHAWGGFPLGNLFSGEAKTLVKYYTAPGDPGKPIIECYCNTVSNCLG